MASTHRDDFESLKIDRSGSSRYSGKGGSQPESQHRGGCLGFLRQFFSLFVVLAVVVGAASAVYRQYDEIRSKPEVTVGLVQQMATGEAEKLWSAKGYIRSVRQAILGTKVAGRVEEILVQEHDKVKKGQVLAIIEHGDLDAMIDQRGATLERAKAELEVAKIELSQKEREVSLVAEHVSKNTASHEETERAESARKMAKARVSALEASVKLMQSRVRELEYTREFEMKLRAPFDGTVVEKRMEVGEVAIPGIVSPTLGPAGILTLADLSDVEVETDISEQMISRVKLRQPAEISVSAISDKRYKGHLRQIIPMGDRTRGTVKAKVKIEAPDGRLFPELAATVHFLPFKTEATSEQRESHLYVNKLAVFQYYGQDYVWVVDRRRLCVNKRQVEVATSKAELARVESGLSAGDPVVLNPPSFLKEGQQIRISDY